MNSNDADVLDRFKTLFASIFGDYSIALHLVVCLVGVMLLLAIVVTIAKLRGLNSAAVASCARDVLLGSGSLLTFLLAPAAIFFFGRAFWTALKS